VFRTASSRQPVATLKYERHDVFRTASSRQPVATISFICAALFVHTKVLFGRKVTSELWGYRVVKPARVLRLFLGPFNHVTGAVIRIGPFQRARQVRPTFSVKMEAQSACDALCFCVKQKVKNVEVTETDCNYLVIFLRR
jgi:hypothetical protein